MPIETIEKLEQMVAELSAEDLTGLQPVPTQQINAVLWKLAEKMEGSSDQLPRQRLVAVKARATRRLKELNSNPYRGMLENSILIRLSKINRELEDKLKIYV